MCADLITGDFVSLGIIVRNTTLKIYVKVKHVEVSYVRKCIL